jgi:hypothetical protein
MHRGVSYSHKTKIKTRGFQVAPCGLFICMGFEQYSVYMFLDVKALESNNWTVLLRFLTYHISIRNKRYLLESGDFQVKAGQANMDGVGMQSERLTGL